jgi:ATP-dependent RNA/DNA helicase IGHMBP2
MDYFKKLRDLLKTEREADRQSYQEIAERSSVNERRENGLSWYPVAIRDTELGRGEYLTVEVERTTHTDILHQFRTGAPAALFSNHNIKEDRVEGIVAFQSGNRLKLTLRTDELPEWSRAGKLGIDLLFDDNSYDEMQSALTRADTLTEKSEEGRLVNILTGEKEPTFQKNLPAITVPGLNASQQEAVNKILSANELAVVHGPPGTGKTTTLVQAVKYLLQQDPHQVLVVAPSNAAVDWLTEKLSDEGLNVLRIGNPARVSERLLSLTLDQKMAEHPHMSAVKKLKKQAAAYKDMAHKYKRNFGRAERDQRKALFDEAHKIMKDVENSEQYILDDLIAKAQVITATLVGASHYTIRHLRYNTVVIDEAGQALEPACWIPIVKAKKVIFAGDHNQLPPTIKSEEAARNGLENTLMEKCVQLHPGSVIMLDEQYRMHEMIMGYSSEVFYKGKLKANAAVAQWVLFEGDTPLSFVDTAGCGYEEKTEGTRISNPEEAAFLFRHLSQFADKLATHYSADNFPSIAVISPYRQQVELLKEELLQSPELQPYLHKISVNTIDSFQGQERDIVYISMTRSNADNRIGFLSEIRRMNVAMTRAKKKLVVIGDSATLSQLRFYADFIHYATARNAWQSAWEFIDG